MALVRGNTTTYHQIPSGSSLSIAHVQDVGADGVLIVSMGHTNSNSLDVTGITYGGVPMTKRVDRNLTGMSQRLIIYELKNPPTGSNNLVFTWNNSLWNFASIQVSSFIGADIGGNTINVGGSSSPNTKSINVSEGSAIYTRGVSPGAFSSIVVAGKSSSGGSLEPNNNNVNSITSGAYSNIGLTAGSYDVVHTSSSNVAISAIEIKASSVAPTPRRRIHIT